MATRKPTSKAAVAANAAVPHAQQLAKLARAVRHEKFLIDTNLAQLYGVETGALNRAVKRNASRFPADFMYQLTARLGRLEMPNWHFKWAWLSPHRYLGSTLLRTVF